jgi:hypothetical protein
MCLSLLKVGKKVFLSRLDFYGCSKVGASPVWENRSTTVNELAYCKTVGKLRYRPEVFIKMFRK